MLEIQNKTATSRTRPGIGKLVTVYGGSGFLGRAVVRQLAQKGFRVRIAVRRPHLAGHLQPLGDVGQIHVVQANLRDERSIERAQDNADMVVNLVGILQESGKQRFETIQHLGAKLVAKAAHSAGVAKLVQVSAIGADLRARSHYARSKARGEADALKHFNAAIILRPSLIFGPEDGFFNRFAAMAEISPALPLIGGGKTKFQPVYVEDVAEAIAVALDGGVAPGTTYELGGPAVYSFKELMQFILNETGRDKALVPVPFLVARLMAFVSKIMPGLPPLTGDQITLLKKDNVVSQKAQKEKRTLEAFGISPRQIEAIVPAYLSPYRRRGQFADNLKHIE